MLISYNEFHDRVNELLGRIADSCRAAGRDAAEVTLLPVTKTHPAMAADYVRRHGLGAVGENRVQEAVEKQAQVLAKDLRWELIGHLQSNKARLAVGHFHRIQSVDSEKLLTVINRAAGEVGRKMPVLLQINAGRDPAKFGAEPDRAARLLEVALAQPHLQVEGLMTIAPLAGDRAVARQTFANLRRLREDLAARFGAPLRELSMGMSGDLHEAIAEGSTQVRVGSALFGPRA